MSPSITLRDLIGYTVLAGGLYLTYLSGADGFELSPYAFAFLLAVIVIAFEKVDSVTKAIDAANELNKGLSDEDDGKK